MGENGKVNFERSLPEVLEYGHSCKISMEDIISKAGLLTQVLAAEFNSAGDHLCREPLPYPVVRLLFEMASDIYFALGENYYKEEVTREGLTSFL